MSDQKPVVFLEGRKTILRPYDEEKDLKLFVRWFNDPETVRFLGSFLFPMSELWERERMRKSASERDDKNVFLVIETKDDQHPIGTLGLHRIDWINRTATTGSCIGEHDMRSRGYGTDAKMALLGYAFDTLGLRLIRSAVIEFNGRSRRALEKQGYVEAGRIPKWHYRNGAYWDEVFFILTPEAFKKACADWSKQ